MKITEGESDVCPACVEGGTEWVHLRMCLTCGNVGCCDSSPMQHSRRHFERDNHALARSLEPREDWAWCFVDEEFLQRREYRGRPDR